MWMTRRSTTESAVNGKCHAHTSEPLAGCPRSPLRAQNMSQMQWLKHEQCRRRNRDIDDNCERKYGDVDGAICHSLTRARPSAERTKGEQERTGRDQANHGHTHDHIKHRLDNEALPSGYGNCANKSSRNCQKQFEDPLLSHYQISHAYGGALEPRAGKRAWRQRKAREP